MSKHSFGIVSYTLNGFFALESALTRRFREVLFTAPHKAGPHPTGRVRGGVLPAAVPRPLTPQQQLRQGEQWSEGRQQSVLREKIFE